MCGAQGGERVGASGRRVSDAARVTSTARRAWLPAAAVGWKTTSCMHMACNSRGGHHLCARRISAIAGAATHTAVTARGTRGSSECPGGSAHLKKTIQYRLVGNYYYTHEKLYYRYVTFSFIGPHDGHDGRSRHPKVKTKGVCLLSWCSAVTRALR